MTQAYPVVTADGVLCDELAGLGVLLILFAQQGFTVEWWGTTPSSDQPSSSSSAVIRGLTFLLFPADLQFQVLMILHLLLKFQKV